MQRQAIIFGAGNIGRGFIGQLFHESGYAITFVDVDADLIATLNRAGAYRLQTVFNDAVQEYRIGPVRAVHGGDGEAVAAAVAAAEIGATAVGAGALKAVAKPLAKGLERRAAAGAPPLNLIICENLKGAAGAVRTLLEEALAPSCQAYLAEQVGLVDTVIGRMVPMPTAEMRAADPGLIRVEPYKELPVDRKGFRGPVPEVVAMLPQDDFAVYTARKLYVHNCGHALLAYCGYLRGWEYGYEALEDPAVQRVLTGGLAESVGGIVAHYGAAREWLQQHVDDLLVRFANRLLGDTVFRLGRDPLRKLAPGDRLIGAATLAMETGALPRHLAWGIGAALNFGAPADPVAVGMQDLIRRDGIAAAMRRITGVEPGSDLGKRVLAAYERLAHEPRAEFPTARQA